MCFDTNKIILTKMAVLKEKLKTLDTRTEGKEELIKDKWEELGSIIGYMLRMGLFRNFTATALGTLTANIAWCYGFEFLEQRFHMIQYVFGAIVVIVMIPYLKQIKKFIAEYRKPD